MDGYPVKLFETLTCRFLNSTKFGDETKIATVPKDIVYISLPYLGQIFHEVEFFHCNYWVVIIILKYLLNFPSRIIL